MRTLIMLAVLSILASGCQKSGERENLIGMSESQLLVKKGEPVYKSNISEKKVFVRFRDQESVHIENDKVVMAFQRPSKPEMSLQHWKQTWSANETEVIFLGEAQGYQFTNKKRKILIILPSDRSEVSKVVTYE